MKMMTMGLSVEESNFKTFDDEEIFFQTWTKKNPKAIVLGIHGLGEHSDSYKPLAQGLADSPYQLAMSDLRGHGRSGGKRGVGSIDDYLKDIKIFHTLLQKRFAGLPIFLLGHSMGGLICLKYLIRNGSSDFKGLVLSSPLMGVTVQIPAIKLKSARFLSKITPNLAMYNEIPLENLTHDKQITRIQENDSFRHSKISPKTFISLIDNFDYVFKEHDKITLPVLMQQAGEDRVVSQPEAAKLFDLLTVRDKKLIVYKDYFHEIYNELDRDKVFADLISWLDAHV